MRGPAMVEGVTRALFAVAQDIVVDAQISITEGAVSGKGHVPSKPGEPPNADTHVLSNSGEATTPEPLKAEAGFNAPYAAAQELGSDAANLLERPYLRPAAQRNRRNGALRVSAAVDKVIRQIGVVGVNG
jgi:hypothetical protein